MYDEKYEKMAGSSACRYAVLKPGSLQRKGLDAKGYVKSVLDAHYHGEYKDYAKYLDISEEEAKADLDKDVDQQIDQEVAAIIDLGDEGKARYKEMLEKVEKLAKYEVKDAKKQDNGNYV
mgnify:CR=1 FL=1